MPMFFAVCAAGTMSLSIHIKCREGLGRREDEITNSSDLSPFNFSLMHNILIIHTLNSFMSKTKKLSITDVIVEAQSHVLPLKYFQMT